MAEQKTDATGIQIAMDPRLIKSVGIILGDETAASRFLRIAWFAASSVPGLQRCTSSSIATAILQAATLRLEVGTALGEAWILPYGAGDDDDDDGEKSRGRVTRAQLQVGYKGWLTLHRRAGVDDINTHLVYEDELPQFRLELGDQPRVVHPRALTTREGVPVVGGYSIAWIPGAKFPNVFWMTRADIDKRREASKSYVNAVKKGKKSSPWIAWPETMERKTVLKGHSPWLPTSEEIGAAMEVDNRADALETRHNPLLDKGPAAELAKDFAMQESASRDAIKERLEQQRAKNGGAKAAPIDDATRAELERQEAMDRQDAAEKKGGA